jgi:hypothetical protein
MITCTPLLVSRGAGVNSNLSSGSNFESPFLFSRNQQQKDETLKDKVALNKMFNTPLPPSLCRKSQNPAGVNVVKNCDSLII